MSPALSSYEDRALYSTWQISFEHVERRNPLSAQLLRLWAYFDNQDLWFELLQHRRFENPHWIRELVEDELSFHGAMRILSDHGLVEVDKSQQELLESQGYSIHGCVHSWTIHVLNQEWDYGLARVATKCIASHAPRQQAIRPWLTHRRLFHHVVRCSHIISNNSVSLYGVEWVLHRIGLVYHELGKLDEAKEMYKRALKFYQKTGFRDHTFILDTIHNLGIVYKLQGKMEQAGKLYHIALQGKEKAYGLYNESTLDTVNDLGIFYADQNMLKEAENMYERAIPGYKKAFGPDHVSTLRAISNFGLLCRLQGKLDKAEEIFQTALQGYEKVLGPDHILIYDTVHNLGAHYRLQGKLDLAEKMFQRALQRKEIALGPEHTSTLSTVFNLSLLYVEQGNLYKAKETCWRILESYKATSTWNEVSRQAVYFLLRIFVRQCATLP
jgi:tetratricopeptide (TPR) repeat protein